MTIKETRATDAGMYSCVFHCGTINISENYLLTINYPPGPTSCQWQEDFWASMINIFSLRILRCSLVNGYPSASVRCYSYRDNIPRSHDPFSIKGDVNLTATFWFDGKVNVTCCSVSSTIEKDWQTCTDFYSDGRLRNHHQITQNVLHNKRHNDPRKLTCVIKPNHDNESYGQWALVECTASKANHHRIIACYQDGQRMLPWNLPIENDTSFIQTIWIQRTMPIFCCSFAHTKQKSLCECNDFITDFSQSGNDILELDPCPETTSPSTTLEIHTTSKPTNCHKLRRDFLNECL